MRERRLTVVFFFFQLCNFEDFANDEDTDSTESEGNSGVEEEVHADTNSPSKGLRRQRRKWSLSNFIVRKLNSSDEGEAQPPTENKDHSNGHSSGEDDEKAKSKQFLGLFRKKHLQS